VQLQLFYNHTTTSTASKRTYKSKREGTNIFYLKITNFITRILLFVEKFRVEIFGSEEGLKI